MGLYNFYGLFMGNISKIAARKGLHLDLRFTDNELGSTDVDSSAEKKQ